MISAVAKTFYFMTPKLFTELGLSPELLKAIDKLGYEQASPIQAAAIPVLMTGKDIVGQSMTGSGKTAAFGVPAVEKVALALAAGGEPEQATTTLPLPPLENAGPALPASASAAAAGSPM